MIAELVFNVFLDLAKNGVLSNINKAFQKEFEGVFNDTLDCFERKYYGLSKTDFKEFFQSREVLDHFEIHKVDRNLDISFLAAILKEYINLIEVASYESVLIEFFEKLDNNLIRYPNLRDQLFLHYLSQSRQAHMQQNQQLEKNTAILIQNGKNLAEIRNILEQPQIEGRTLKPNDLINNTEFFKRCIESLNRDPYYKYEINLSKDGRIITKIIPRSEEAEKAQPIRINFTVNLKQKNGKVITPEEMLEEAYRKGTSVVFDPDSIEEVSIYKGDVPLIPKTEGSHRIELKPHPPDPIKICVPGCDVSYIAILYADKKDSLSRVLSNEAQDSPIKFRFDFEFNSEGKLKGNVKFNIHTDLEEMDVKQRLQLSEFLRAVYDHKVLELKDVNSNKLIFRVSLDEFAPELDSQDFVDAIKKLAFIQDITSTRIPCPSKISKADFASIDKVFQYFRNRKLEAKLSSSVSMTVVRESASHLSEVIAGKNVFDDLTIREDERIENVCGVDISLGPIVTHLPPMKAKNSVVVLRDFSDSMKDTVEIEFEPISDSTMIILPVKLS